LRKAAIGIVEVLNLKSDRSVGDAQRDSLGVAFENESLFPYARLDAKTRLGEYFDIRNMKLAFGRRNAPSSSRVRQKAKEYRSREARSSDNSPRASR
jgi:hypothetical protein